MQKRVVLLLKVIIDVIRIIYNFGVYDTISKDNNMFCHNYIYFVKSKIVVPIHLC